MPMGVRQLVTIASYWFLFAATALAQTFNPDNGHYYQLETLELTWDAARAMAEGSSFAGANGHLVTITSATEQLFVETHFVQLPYKLWLGGFQPSGSFEPAGGWQWVTGEPFVYTHWRSGEPNNVGGIEYLLEMFGGLEGTWNDVGAIADVLLPREPTKRRFVIEYSVPEPSALATLFCCAAAFCHFCCRRA